MMNSEQSGVLTACHGLSALAMRAYTDYHIRKFKRFDRRDPKSIGGGR